MAPRNTYFQDEVIEKKVDIKQFASVLRYALPYKKIFILVGALMFVAAGVSLISPLLLKMIINEVVVDEDYRKLAFIIGGLVLLAAIEIGVNFLHQRLMGKVIK